MFERPTDVVIGLSVFLFIAVLLSAIIVLGLHFYRNHQERRRQRLYQQWRPLLMSYVHEGEELEKLQRVAKDQPNLLLELIAHQATLLKGVSFQRVQQLAVDSAIADYIVNLLKSRREWKISLGARSIATLKLPLAREQLLRLLKRDNEGVVFAAALALSRTGTPEDLPAVLEVLSEFSATNQDLVTIVLIGFATEHPEEYLRYLHENPLPDEDLRALALEAIGHLRLRDEHGLLLREMVNPKSDDCLLKSIRVAGETMALETRPQLRELAQSGDWRVRGLAAWSLGRFRNDADVPLLKQMLNDSHWSVRLNSAAGLVEMERPGLDALQEVASSGESDFAGDMARHALEFHEKALPLK